MTTRAPREGEKDGRDYYFFSREEFDARYAAGDFLESALVHGRAYGTLSEEVIQHFQKKEDVLLSIDVQGMRQIRERASDFDWLSGRLVTVFINPPSLDELRERLRRRGSDDEEEIERRIESARKEIQAVSEFDYILDTGTREEDFDRIRSIYLSEKMRVR
ncbi:guanylate kinase [Puniceicoccus vermicola]